MFYSKSEKIHSLKSICVRTGMHVWCMSVCLLYIKMSKYRFVMHAQSNRWQSDISTIILLRSALILFVCLLCLFFIFRILSWLIEETCNLSKLTFFFFGVEYISFLYIYKWNRSPYVYDSIQNWASYIVYIETEWHIHFFFQLYIFKI
jgi:hypothetical protein